MAIRCQIKQAAQRDDDGLDPGASALQVYVQLSDAPYAYGVVLDETRVIDYAADGTPIGVEFLQVSDCASLTAIPQADEVGAALRAHDIPVCA